MRQGTSRSAQRFFILALLLSGLGAKTAEVQPPSVHNKSRDQATTQRRGVFRFSSYPAAWTAAQKSQRPILIFVSSPSCRHCTQMLAKTYQVQGVRELIADRFETVYVDRIAQPRLAQKLRVRRYPTTIVVGPDNQVMDVIEGFVEPDSYTRRLAANLTSKKDQRESAAIAMTTRSSP